MRTALCNHTRSQSLFLIQTMNLLRWWWLTVCRILSSGKNVLLEFYAPWCGHCKKLAPILDEVAVSFENDPDVIFAKIDAAANDIPCETFDVKCYPTLYFEASSGNVVQYDGDRTKDDMVDFIQKHRDTVAKQGSRKEELRRRNLISTNS